MHMRSSLRIPRLIGRAPLLAAANIVGVVASLLLVSPAQAATSPRSFSCTGGLGEAFTLRTVSGLLTITGVPYQVSVTETGAGIVDSTRARKAGLVGPSWLHAGFTQWDVTGYNPSGDLFFLHIPPVLPGNGGFFDADLEIQFAGGANGGWQIPMFDCTVTGGPAWMSTPAGPRRFTCTGGLGEAFTFRTVTGQLTWLNAPNHVTVTQTGSGAVDSARLRKPTLIGPSWLRSGYNEWDVTGHNANGDLFFLNLPPVLPGVGGFFDADLEIQFSGGANGGWQIPMFDCTVN